MSRKRTLDTYLTQLGARCPTPGGGSAAALVGAIGASLLMMVSAYLAGKLPGAAAAKVRGIRRFAGGAQRRLRQLMVEDEKTYLRLSRTRKKYAFAAATRLSKDAAEVPLEVCGILAEGLKKCLQLSLYCKASLVSDLAEAAILMEAALLSAKFTADLNLIVVKDARYAARVKSELSRARSSAARFKKEVLRKCRHI